MLCVCHTTLTQNGSVCNILSGWASTTTVRLRGDYVQITLYDLCSRSELLPRDFLLYLLFCQLCLRVYRELFSSEYLLYNYIQLT